MKFSVTDNLLSEVSGVNSPLTSSRVKSKVTLKTINRTIQVSYVYVKIHPGQYYFLIHTCAVLKRAKELYSFNRRVAGFTIHQ